MSDETITVTLTLRKGVAEKPRAICHRRGEKASLVVDRWICDANDAGEIKPAVQTKTQAERITDLFEKLGGRPL